MTALEYTLLADEADTQHTEPSWWSDVYNALSGIVNQLTREADTTEGPGGDLTVAVSRQPSLTRDARILLVERARLLQRAHRLRRVIDFEFGQESQVSAIKHEYRMLTIELDDFHVRTRSLIRDSFSRDIHEECA